MKRSRALMEIAYRLSDLATLCAHAGLDQESAEYYAQADWFMGEADYERIVSND